jgi:hypothetical protein
VTGARDRQELGQPFDDAHQGGFDQQGDIQDSDLVVAESKDRKRRA